MKPDRKIVAAAITTVIVWLVQELTGLDVPVGVEGAVVTIVGYFTPSRGVDLSGPLTNGPPD